MHRFVLIAITGNFFLPAIGLNGFLAESSQSPEGQELEPQSCVDGQCAATDLDLQQYYQGAKRHVDINFGEKQEVGGEHWRITLDNLEKTRDYMKTVRADRNLLSVRNACQCRHELCSFWAAVGWRGSSSGWMPSLRWLPTRVSRGRFRTWTATCDC